MKGIARSARVEAPRSPQPRPRGNPRLGRETEDEKAKRMGTWRAMNALMKQDGTWVHGDVHKALGVTVDNLGTDVIRSSGIHSVLDTLFNDHYWR
jgi:hypothetical protein